MVVTRTKGLSLAGKMTMVRNRAVSALKDKGK